MLHDEMLFGAVGKEGQATPFLCTSEQRHDLIVVYTSGGKRWQVQNYGQEQHEEFSETVSAPPESIAGQIVFIRGFISPSWVCALGSKYNIDPEFFRRHMDFLSAGVGGHAYSLPSLASSSHNIVRLCVSTILNRDDFSGKNLQSQRFDHRVDMETYRIQQLASTRMCCGDSMVREYSTLCSRFSVVEQWISFCIAKTESGWTGKSLTAHFPGSFCGSPTIRHVDLSHVV